MFTTVRTVCDSDGQLPPLTTWKWRHLHVPRASGDKRVTFADDLRGGREIDDETSDGVSVDTSDPESEGSDTPVSRSPLVMAVCETRAPSDNSSVDSVEATVETGAATGERPRSPPVVERRALLGKCSSCGERFGFFRRKYVCGECASHVCRLCHKARGFLCCAKEEWKTMRQGLASAAKACDRARARWGLALTMVVTDVRRRAALRAKWKQVISLAVASGSAPASECRRAGACLLPFCSHTGHVRCATHLSERAAEHRDVKKRSKLRAVTRATYASTARRPLERQCYDKGAVFVIRRGDANRTVRDDASGMVIECTNAGYEGAYLKLQLGYIGTRDAHLRNEFMSENSAVVHEKSDETEPDKKKNTPPIAGDNAKTSAPGNYHWPNSGRDAQYPRPDETGDVDVDAAGEIRHFWRVAPEIWRSAYHAIWSESVEHVRLNSGSDGPRRFSRKTRDCWEKRRPEMTFSHGWNKTILAGARVAEHQYAYNGEKFVTQAQATDDMFLLFGDETKLMHEERFLGSTAAAMRRVTDEGAAKMTLVQGVPGCGKTTYIANKAKSVGRTQSVDERGRRDDTYLLLTATRGARDDLLQRVGGQAHSRDVRTIDSWLLHGGDKYKEIYVDEALMVHRGAVVLAGALAECDIIHLLGDVRQIPFINRVPEIEIRLAGYEDVEIERVLSVTHRCPRDVAGAISPLYASMCDRVTSTSVVSKSRKREWTTCLDSVPKVGHDVYLVFKKSEKSDMIKSGYKNVWTVHEFQGQQADDVAVVRLSDKPQEELYLRPEHSLVAFTRHRRHLTYYCPVESDALVALMNVQVDESEFRDTLVGGGACRVQRAVDRALARLDADFKWDIVMCMPNAAGVNGLRSRYGEFMNHVSDVEGWRELRPVLVTDDPHLLHYGKRKICVLPMEKHRRYKKGGACHRDSWDASRECPEVITYHTHVAAYNLQEICDEFEAYSTLVQRKAIRLAAQFGHSGIGLSMSDPDEDISEGWRPPPGASIESEARVTAGKEIFQVFLDEIQSPSCGVGKEHDGDQVEYGNLELTLDGVRVDATRRPAPVSRWDKLTPTLRTTMSCQRMNTQVETLLALLKRNLGVPELSAMNDVEELSDKMLMMFMDAYVDVGRVEDGLLDVDVEKIENWMKKQKFTAASLDEEIVLTDTDWSSYDFMVKKNVKPDMTRNAEWTYSALQTIATWPKKIMFAVFSPVFTTVMERLKKALRRHVVVNTGYTPGEFSDHVSDVIPPSLVRDVPSLECDLKKYDKAQGVLARRVMCKFFRRFGVAEHLIDLWDVANTDTTLNAWEAGLRVNVPDQCKSGESATYLRNTVWAMVTAAMCFDMGECVASLFSGDDSVLWGNLRTQDATYLYENVANLECKMIRHRIVEFCGKFLIPVEDGWAIVPNPFKAILKLGRRDMTNWYHVEAYRVSATDNLASLKSGHLGDDLARAMHERYELDWVNAEVLVSGLLEVASSMASFSRLFYAGPNARICQDKSLPNLDI